MPLVPDKAKQFEFSTPTFVVIAAIHIFAIALAPFTFSWPGLIAMAVIGYVAGGFGITLCYHRLLTHSSYKTYRPIKYLLTILGIMALEGGPIKWTAVHRVHHKESDEVPDPHTPFQGFLWSHILWLFYTDPELGSYDQYQRFAKDLGRDPVMRFLDKWNFVIYLLGLVALFVVGWLVADWKLGLSLFIWGGLLRTVLVWHGTWLVNSATHMWGYRNYLTSDNSRNTWWVALISFGEGWHNNHHADQRSAAHGHKWYEFDVTYLTIKAMSFVGLASDVVKPRNKDRMIKHDDAVQNNAA